MKRFTETDKWKDPWFRRLDGRLKLLWMWLCDQCDHAGIIDPDMDLAAFQIGVVVTEMDLAAFDGRLSKLQNGKWMLTKFIAFQYGELSVDCRAHGPVFKSLENNRVSKGYAKGIHTLQDKDKDKDKDKDTGNLNRDSIDEQWVQSLRTNAAYAGLNIDHQLAKAQAWASTNRRQCSRKFFINWLNRAEQPVMVNGHDTRKPSEKY